MHSHIMPPKLALNSCCSLKCNAFTLCIHTKAGCLGDTQNGRSYVTKCWRNDDNGNMEECGWAAVLVCNGEREHNKQMADEWEETRHCYSTYKDCSGQVHQRVQKTQIKTLPSCIVKWKLTVNSQNRVAMTQPRYRTQTSYILTVSLQTHCLLEKRQYLTSPAAHRNKDSGQWCNSNSPKLPWGQTETRHTARTVGSAHMGEPTDTCRLYNKHFWVTVQEGNSC